MQIYHESSQVMCDATALGELMNSVNHACCDDPDIAVECTQGIPSACSVDCASAFLPLWPTCHETLAGLGGIDFAHFADQCGQALSAGAESRCGYAEVIPIIMACTDIAPEEDFCVRHSFPLRVCVAMLCEPSVPVFHQSKIDYAAIMSKIGSMMHRRPHRATLTSVPTHTRVME